MLFKKNKIRAYLLSSLLVVSQVMYAQAAAPISGVSISKILQAPLSTGLTWNQVFAIIYQQSALVHEQSNIGILNILDAAGYPVGLPVHFEYKQGNFYFSSGAAAQRNKIVNRHRKVSLLIYYKSLNQLTILVKGVVAATDIHYQYTGGNGQHQQILYKIEPQEVNISFLDEASRHQQEIIRHLYLYKKNNKQWRQAQRNISIQNTLDDLEEIIKKHNPQPLRSILPN